MVHKHISRNEVCQRNSVPETLNWSVYGPERDTRTSPNYCAIITMMPRLERDVSPKSKQQLHPVLST